MRSALIAAGVVGLLLLALLGAAAAFLARGGISARAEPSRAEVRISRAVRRWAIPSSAREALNPVPPSPRALARGRAHFADHCAICHGNDGAGQTSIGRSHHPRAPDMRSRGTQELTDGELFHIIENGIRLTGMPAWGGAEDPEASWQLVHFIRHLPRLTEEEKSEMEALNPKSPDEWRALQEEDAFLEGAAPAQPGSGGHSHGRRRP
jgi:mono/diheme cytochrome c family protein